MIFMGALGLNIIKSFLENRKGFINNNGFLSEVLLVSRNQKKKNIPITVSKYLIRMKNSCDSSDPTEGKCEAAIGKVGMPISDRHIAQPYANVRESLRGMSKDDDETSWGRCNGSDQESYGDKQQVYPMRKALSEESLGSQFSMQSSDLRADMLRDELRKKIQEEEKLRKELDEARGEVQSLVAARPLLKHVAKLRKTATSAIQALRHKEKDKEKEEASQDELRHEEVDLQAEEDDLFQVRRITAHLNVLQEKIRDLEKKRELPLPSDEEDFADFTITDPLRLKDKVKVIDSDTDEEKKVAETRDESKAVEEAANPVDDVLPPTSSKIVELPEFTSPELEQESEVLRLAKENAELLEKEQEKLKSIREDMSKMQQKLFAENLKSASSWKDTPDPSDGATWNEILKDIKDNFYADFNEYGDRLETMVSEINPVYGQEDLDGFVTEMLKVDWTAGNIVKGFLMSNAQLFIAATLIGEARTEANTMKVEVSELERELDHAKDSMHSHAEAERNESAKIQEMEDQIEDQKKEIAKLKKAAERREKEIEKLEKDNTRLNTWNDEEEDKRITALKKEKEDLIKELKEVRKAEKATSSKTVPITLETTSSETMRELEKKLVAEKAKVRNEITSRSKIKRKWVNAHIHELYLRRIMLKFPKAQKVLERLEVDINETIREWTAKVMDNLTVYIQKIKKTVAEQVEAAESKEDIHQIVDQCYWQFEEEEVNPVFSIQWSQYDVDDSEDDADSVNCSPTQKPTQLNPQASVYRVDRPTDKSDKGDDKGETVFGIYEDIVQPAEEAMEGMRIGRRAAAVVDVKFNISELPKWDGGHTTTDGYEATLRQFVQRIEDISRMKGWDGPAKVMMLPNMLQKGMRHAFDRWRLNHPDRAREWRDNVMWLERQDKATPTRTITNEKLYSIKMLKNESVEDYTARFYEVSAGYREGGDAVLKSIYINGTNNHLKAYLMGKILEDLDATIAAARTWSATQQIKNAGNMAVSEKKNKPRDGERSVKKESGAAFSDEKAKTMASRLAGKRVFYGPIKTAKDSKTGKFCNIHKKDTHDTAECKIKPYVRKKGNEYYFEGGDDDEKPERTWKTEIKKEEASSLSESIASIARLFDTKRKEMNDVATKKDGTTRDYSTIKCYSCGKMGHYASKCYSNPKSENYKGSKKEQNDVEEQDAVQGDKKMTEMIQAQMEFFKKMDEKMGEHQNLVKESKGPNATLKFQIKNGQQFVGTLDSAANRTTMSEKTAKRLGLEIGKYEGPQLWSATGNRLQMVGTVNLTCWPVDEPSREINEKVHISRGGTEKTLIGYRFLTNNGFCLLPNLSGGEGWSIVTQEHISVSKKGIQQFGINQQHAKEEAEILAVIADFQEEICGIFEDEVTFEDVFTGLESGQLNEWEVSSVLEDDYVSRQTPSDEQIVDVTKVDKTAVYHPDAKKVFDTEFMMKWEKKFEKPKGVTHEPVKIVLKEGHSLTKMQPYRTTPEKRRAWQEFEEKALKDGRIFHSNAAWCVPGLIIEKPGLDKNGRKRWRPLIDLRPLNDAVEDVCYPLPSIPEIFASQRGMKVFYKLDLQDAFHQITLHKDSQLLTTFVTPSGMYYYKKMPQGYKNAPAEFQRVVDQTMRKVRHKLRGVCRVYFDDVVGGALNMEDLKHDAEIVLQQIYEDGWALQPIKCTFGATAVDFLGYKISSNGKGVQTQLKEKLTKKIMEAIAQPLTEQADMKLMVQKITGFLNYYRKFAPKMSSKIDFVTKRLRKNAQLESFTEEEVAKLLAVIEEIASAGNFALPDSSLPTVIIHDASGIGCGYLAMQEFEGEVRLIDMDSRNFPIRKREIATIDRELSGMLFAMIKLGHIISLSKATFYTDHQALIGLIKKFDGGLVHGRRAQAILMLRGSGAAFRHIPGASMLMADALSRWKEGGNIADIARASLIEKDLGIRCVLQSFAEATNYLAREKQFAVCTSVHTKYDGKGKEPNDVESEIVIAAIENGWMGKSPRRIVNRWLRQSEIAYLNETEGWNDLMIRFMAIIEVKTGTDLENEELNEKIRRKPAVALQLTEMLNEAIEDAQANTAPWSKLFLGGGD